MISRRKDVMNGQPCIEGTTIRTSLIAGMWRQGLDYEGIRAEFPELSRQQIEAAVRYEDRLDRRIVDSVRRLRHGLGGKLRRRMRA